MGKAPGEGLTKKGNRAAGTIRRTIRCFWKMSVREARLLLGESGRKPEHAAIACNESDIFA